MDKLPIKRGMNLHTADYRLEDELVSEKYFKIIKDAGFDHLRLPVRGGHLEDLGQPYWDHVRSVAERVLACGLIPIIDMHWYKDLNKDPHGFKEGFWNLWEKLAEYWADMDRRVIFEICNEPNRKYTFDLVPEIQNEAIRRIRKTNPDRLLLAAPAHYNVIENLHFLDLPEDDPNIIVTIHDYTPMALTHQGMGNRPTTDYKWDTPEMRNYLTARFDFAAAWGKLHNRMLHLGEFGVAGAVDMEQRASWTKFIVKLCEERGIGFSFWEFWKGFGAYDRANDCWKPELLKALIQD